jgi:hypothetical protein
MVLATKYSAHYIRGPLVKIANRRVNSDRRKRRGISSHFNLRSPLSAASYHSR